MTQDEQKEMRKRIFELTDRCKAENDPTKLLGCLKELNRLIDHYRKEIEKETGRSPPERRFYEPTTVDVQWARMMITVIRQDGVMAFPSSRLIYRINHKDKTLTLLNPDVLLQPDGFLTHLKTIEVFKEVNYAVAIVS